VEDQVQRRGLCAQAGHAVAKAAIDQPAFVVDQVEAAVGVQVDGDQTVFGQRDFRPGPGQVLIAEGTVDDWMMVLLAGTVDVTKRKVGAESDGEEAGDTTRLAVIRPGAVIGEMSMLDGEPRYATCTALDEVEAAVLTRAAVGQLIHDHPAVSAKLLVKITQLLAQRLRNTSNQLVRKLRADAAVSG